MLYRKKIIKLGYEICTRYLHKSILRYTEFFEEEYVMYK